MQASQLVVKIGVAKTGVTIDSVFQADPNVTVETGSFNFTKAAETKNSENAVVIWNMPKLAESFLEHWQDRWNRGRDYRSSY
ncbi:TPA: hypothetical protein MG504_25940 [Klebsiella pneumoniae]|nr:hypothetical protein [Klebsiella pneumoniae]